MLFFIKRQNFKFHNFWTIVVNRVGDNKVQSEDLCLPYNSSAASSCNTQFDYSREQNREAGFEKEMERYEEK